MADLPNDKRPTLSSSALRVGTASVSGALSGLASDLATTGRIGPGMLAGAISEGLQAVFGSAQSAEQAEVTDMLAGAIDDLAQTYTQEQVDEGMRRSAGLISGQVNHSSIYRAARDAVVGHHRAARQAMVGGLARLVIEGALDDDKRAAQVDWAMREASGMSDQQIAALVLFSPGGEQLTAFAHSPMIDPDPSAQYDPQMDDAVIAYVEIGKLLKAEYLTQMPQRCRELRHEFMHRWSQQGVPALNQIEPNLITLTTSGQVLTRHLGLQQVDPQTVRQLASQIDPLGSMLRELHHDDRPDLADDEPIRHVYHEQDTSASRWDL